MMPLGASCRGHKGLNIKSTFSEYGHVAYQIKGNETYSNMIANSFPLHTPLTPGVGSKGPRSAVGNVSGYRCEADCRSRGREFDPGPVPYFRGD